MAEQLKKGLMSTEKKKNFTRVKSKENAKQCCPQTKMGTKWQNLMNLLLFQLNRVQSF